MQNGSLFHDKTGQDDWSKDQSGVQYFHFYGVQKKLKTIGKVLALKSPQFDSEGNPIYVNSYDYMTRQGDGTVPLISAERMKGFVNLNAPNAVKRAFNSPSPRPDDDASVEHTELTKNPQVWDAILSALKTSSPQSALNLRRPARSVIQNISFRSGQDPISTQDQPTEITPSEAYYLRIVSSQTIENFNVTDASGKSLSQIGENPFRNSLPDITVTDWDNAINVILPVEIPENNFYNVTFNSNGSPVEVRLTKGVGNDPETATQIIRYLDINLPAGTKMMLKFTAHGVEDLRYDANGDGTFKSTIQPTASLTGKAAQDTEPPEVSFKLMQQQSNAVITITATDDVSGVKAIRYSLDGKKFQLYTAPLTVNPCKISTVYAIADDNAANRSSTFTYMIPNRPPDVSQAKPSIAIIAPAKNKFIPVTIQGVVDPDCDAVAIRIDRIMQDEMVKRKGDTDDDDDFDDRDDKDDKTICPDAKGVGTATAQLRAKRSGKGNGRVYTIYFTATDSKGNSSQGSVKVSVPKKKKDVAIDDGARFDSTACQ